MLGLFTSLGPSFIKNNKLVHNPNSWNNNASVIFIDQPVNSGYSHTSSKPVGNSVDAAKDIYALLTLFFQQFPQYASQDFHIAGESYAGHYIPAFAAEILSRKPQDRNINLKSVMIGNGIVDALTQYASYQPMACGEGGYPAVLSPEQCQTAKTATPQCLNMVSDCYKSRSSSACQAANSFCDEAFLAPYAETGKSIYDVRDSCSDPTSTCSADSLGINEFLSQPSFLNAIGAEAQSFQACSDSVYTQFSQTAEIVMPYQQYISSVLQQIPVLIYAGDADYICNWIGNLAWTDKLEWTGKADYNAAQMKPFLLSNGTEAGQSKTAKGLTFLKVYGAGHAVPGDKPEAALQFLNKWLANVKTSAGLA
ncbi:hypothetical protein ABW20_dc0110645 [Dactylellina cionopaga]|nr:hypothetical protein ABW20_dc0110645 [Dactylellina cionopaga]